MLSLFWCYLNRQTRKVGLLRFLLEKKISLSIKSCIVSNVSALYIYECTSFIADWKTQFSFLNYAISSQRVLVGFRILWLFFSIKVLHLNTNFSIFYPKPFTPLPTSAFSNDSLPPRLQIGINWIGLEIGKKKKSRLLFLFSGTFIDPRMLWCRSDELNKMGWDPMHRVRWMQIRSLMPTTTIKSIKLTRHERKREKPTEIHLLQLQMNAIELDHPCIDKFIIKGIFLDHLQIPL